MMIDFIKNKRCHYYFMIDMTGVIIIVTHKICSHVHQRLNQTFIDRLPK